MKELHGSKVKETIKKSSRPYVRVIDTRVTGKMDRLNLRFFWKECTCRLKTMYSILGLLDFESGSFCMYFLVQY